MNLLLGIHTVLPSMLIVSAAGPGSENNPPSNKQSANGWKQDYELFRKRQTRAKTHCAGDTFKLLFNLLMHWVKSKKKKKKKFEPVTNPQDFYSGKLNYRRDIAEVKVIKTRIY